jgi:hemolysin D
MYSTDDKDRFKPHLVEIEESPVSPLGRKILWAIVLFMLVAAIWLFVGKTDVVVSGRAKVIPSGDVKILQALNGGSVSKIAVKEGEEVKKGDLLIEIDPTIQKSDLEAKKRTIEILSLEVEKLKALIDGKEFKVSTDVTPEIAMMVEGMYSSQKGGLNSEELRIDQQIRQTEDQIRATKLDIERTRELYRLGMAEERRLKSVLDIIAKNDYYAKVKENRSYKRDIDIKSQEVMRLQNRLNELKAQKDSIRDSFRNRLYETLSQRLKELTALKSEVTSVEFTQKKQIITSPVDGVVSKVSINTIGAVVTPAQELVAVIPKNAPMQLKAIVENKDIGFIKRGMEAAIKIDTYDYQKYGLLKGEVQKISPNAIEDKKLGLIYEVYIEPKKNYLEVDGEKRYLIPGMSATAELKVGERRIIEFFIYPLIKYYKEGVSVR